MTNSIHNYRLLFCGMLSIATAFVAFDGTRAAGFHLTDGLTSKDIGAQTPSLGDGFNEVSGTTAGRCIAYTPGDVQSVGGSGLEPVSIQDITTSSSMRQTLSISGAASFGVGIYSGSASAQFYQQVIGSEYAHYITVHEKIELGQQKINTGNVKASDFGKAALKVPHTFLAKCGSEFVSGESRGAELTLVYKFEASSESSEQSLSADLSGSATWASASLETNITKASTEKGVSSSLFIYSPGYVGRIPDSGDIHAIMQFVLNYPTLIGNGNVYEQSAESYASVFAALDPGYSAAVQQIDALADKYERAERLYQSLVYIQENSGEFSPFATVSDQDVSLAESAVEALKQRAIDCSWDSLKCDASDIPVPAIKLPDRIYWKTVDATNSSYQIIANVPANTTKTMQVEGAFDRHMGDNIWVDAEDGNAEYQLVGPNGGATQGVFRGPTVQVTGPAQVEVRVMDSTGAPGYTDNSPTGTCGDGQTVCVSLW